MKKCPKCAEKIQDEAEVCRFCKYEFSEAQMNMTYRWVTVRPFVKIGGAILLVLFVARYFSDLTQSPDIQKAIAETQPSSGPPVVVTPEALRVAYEANEVAAQGQFGNRALDVSGVVSDIRLDFRDRPVVALKTSKSFDTVSARLDEGYAPYVARLKKGQDVRFLCDGVSEVIGTPILSGCIMP